MRSAELRVRRLRGSQSDRPTSAGVILIATVVVLLAQLVRTFMPLAMTLAGDLHGARGYLVGVGWLCLAFALSVAAWHPSSVTTSLRPRAAVVGSTATIVAARIVLQLIHPIPVWLGIAALGVALGALPVLADVARRVGGADALLAGVLLGLAIDTSIRGAFSTWDPVWQEGALPLTAVVAIGIAAIVAAVTCRVEGGHLEPLRGSWRLSLFGPFFALQLLFLQNAAALASQASVSISAATAILVAANAIALIAVRIRTRQDAATDAALGLVGAAATYALVSVHGIWVVVLVIALQAIMATLLRRVLTLEGRGGAGRESFRTAVPTLVGALAFLALVLAYQPPIRYRVPFSPAATLTSAFVIVWAGALTRGSVVRTRARHPAVALVVAILLVPTAVASVAAFTAAPTAIAPAPTRPTVTVVTFNIHGAANLDGQIDPESTAREILSQHPDVVVLEEVGRGWPIFGELDGVAWLSDRLDMPYVFEPAADGQLGNAILSRFPIGHSGGGLLPSGPEPQPRSYVTATVLLGTTELLVIGVHLQGGPDDATRARQIDRVLDLWGGRPRTIVAGDMNMEPGDADVRRWVAAGFVSAQDELVSACEPTVVEPEGECERLDWIFATPDLGLSAFEVVPGAASDHRPLAVTVSA